MNKEQLATDLLKAIQPKIEEFVSQPSPAAKEAQESMARLDKARASLARDLGEDSAAFKAMARSLDEQQKALKVDDSSQRKQNLQLAAEAMMVVANQLRLPLKLRETGSGASSSGGGGGGGKRVRRSGEEIQRQADAVLKALPSGNRITTKAEIAEKVGFDPGSALLRLKREGLAESNGKRGSGGGWRKAS